MKTLCALALAFLTLALSLTALAQTAPKKTKAAADPEGQPPRRALPASVKVERDIVYTRYGSREVKLDLYLPKQPASGKTPCIVVVHGGGWRSGDKTRFAHIAGALAEQGFAAACIGYRLLPEVEFPAPVVDCKAAVRWVRANAAKHGLDPDRIGAIGGSAGGHLVALLGTSDTVEKLEGDGGHAGVSSRVHAVVAMATPADMTRMGDRQNLGADLAKLISPVTHVTKNSAPVTATKATPASAPENIEGIAFPASLTVFDADNRTPTVVCRTNQVLPSTAVDAFEAEPGWPIGHCLIALESAK